MDMNCAYCAKGELVAKFGYEVSPRRTGRLSLRMS